MSIVVLYTGVYTRVENNRNVFLFQLFERCHDRGVSVVVYPPRVRARVLAYRCGIVSTVTSTVSVINYNSAYMIFTLNLRGKHFVPIMCDSVDVQL